MADRVDAAMQAMQVAGAYPSIDRRVAQSGPEELVMCDDTVLARRRGRDSGGHWSGCLSHVRGDRDR